MTNMKGLWLAASVQGILIQNIRHMCWLQLLKILAPLLLVIKLDRELPHFSNSVRIFATVAIDESPIYEIAFELYQKHSFY